jgi:hypothetical protein
VNSPNGLNPAVKLFEKEYGVSFDQNKDVALILMARDGDFRGSIQGSANVLIDCISFFLADTMDTICRETGCLDRMLSLILRLNTRLDSRFQDVIIRYIKTGPCVDCIRECGTQEFVLGMPKGVG